MPAAAARLRLSWSGLDRRFRTFLLVVVLFTLGNSSDAFIILRAQERGLSVLQVLGMLLTFNAVYALLSGPAGSLSDRIGRRALVLGGWLVYAVIYLGLAVAGGGWQIWTLFGFYGIYYGLTEGATHALVADFVPAEQRLDFRLVSRRRRPDRPASVLHCRPAMAGRPRLAWFGPAAPFLFGAGMALLAVVLFVTLVRSPEQ